MIQAIVVDIEGTTSSIAFVHDTLFPYARERMHAFLRAHAEDPEVLAHMQAVAEEAGCAPEPDAVAAELLAWMDADRKATPLKAVQGMIWEQGYAEGNLQGHVYPDTPEWLHAWHTRGLALYVYSSGSAAAQKLIFGHSVAGDLRGYFSGFFDTRVGGKKEASSYDAIRSRIGLAASEILFLSDVGAELDAAAAAGLQTCQLLRDAGTEPAEGHPRARDFAEVNARFALS
jgi:enolase-phosphatase E1